MRSSEQTITDWLNNTGPVADPIHEPWANVRAQLRELRTSRDTAIADLRRLQERYDDLSAQNEELRKGTTLSPQEKKEIAELRASFHKLNEEQNKLSLWLRDNKAKQISQGRHMGMSISDVCIMYMAKTLEEN